MFIVAQFFSVVVMLICHLLFCVVII